jgi:hypothetical protein
VAAATERDIFKLSDLFAVGAVSIDFPALGDYLRS